MPLPAYIDRRRVFHGAWYGPKGPTRPAGQGWAYPVLFLQLDPASQLARMNLTCAQWRLVVNKLDAVANAVAREGTSVGGDAAPLMAAVARINAYCAKQRIPSSFMGVNMPTIPRVKLYPAGQTAVTSFVGTDAAGNHASYDSTGAMIPGTALTNDNVRLPDSAMGPADTMMPVSASPPVPDGRGAPLPGTTTTTTQQTSITRTNIPFLGSFTMPQIAAGVLGIAAVGLIGYAATRPAAAPAKKRARANPSRRRRHRRNR